MENENKENKEQGQEMEFDTWNEMQFYDENIVPKIREIAELCNQRKIPYLFHVHYSHDEKDTGVGTRCACFGKKSIQNNKIGACGAILSNAIDHFGLAMLDSVAMVTLMNKK